jgi:hypothetical protein
MARIVPSETIIPSGPEVRLPPELRTLIRLRDGLDDQHTIYHSVRWAEARDVGSVYGEIDFIVANRFGRLLAIEQKDGQLLTGEHGITARYASTRNPDGSLTSWQDKSVVTQVNRNLNGLRKQFARRHPGRMLHVDHLLYLPTARLAGSLPSSVDPARVVDADRDAELVRIVEALLEAEPPGWSVDSLNDLPRITDFLSQTVGAVPDIGVLGRTARETTSWLSGGLSTWALRLSLDPWRLRVRGTAGSGKTQLALEMLKQAHEAGRSALYVCFNRPLADAMKQLAPDPRAVVTFHELARLAITEAGGAPVAFDRQGAFDDMAQAFVRLSPSFGKPFDMLVIDEGQDFAPDWAHCLIGMARDDARVLWLEDPEQALYVHDPVALPGWPVLASPVNYRSPRLLVDFANWLALTDEPVVSAGPVQGYDPGWIIHADADTPVEATAQAVHTLLERGFRPPNIAVLSCRGLANSRIAGAHGPTHLAGLAVKRQDGYDAEGNAVWTDGALLVDSVYRFKGQAADAVVITDIDFAEIDARSRRLLFVALTRARLHAILVTSDRAARVLRDRLA